MDCCGQPVDEYIRVARLVKQYPIHPITKILSLGKRLIKARYRPKPVEQFCKQKKTEARRELVFPFEVK